MIVVTIELWPLGDERRKQHLGTMVIGNDATGDVRTGNYNVSLSKKDADRGPNGVSWFYRGVSFWRRGRVEGFPRLRLGPYDLLYRALRATVGDRNAD